MAKIKIDELFYEHPDEQLEKLTEEYLELISGGFDANRDPNWIPDLADPDLIGTDLIGTD
ncbi:MAG: hypothetical protein AB4426_03745 [Xenococcaceae cyanobacterium]